MAPSSFCGSITDANDELIPDIIVRGSFIGNGNQGSEIKINQVLFGSTNKNKILLEYSFCAICTDELIGDREYVFALRRTANNYRFLNCAISYLKIENEHVIGKIAPGIDRKSISDHNPTVNCNS